MKEVVLTGVFSIVMLMFMIIPAIKTTHWIESKIDLTPLKSNILTILLVIIYSIAVGLFLRYA